MAKRFADLTDQEIIALAISSEEEDSRIYGDIADGLRENYPATTKVFQEMQGQEQEHRRELTESYKRRFGERIPLIRRQDVRGFVRRRPVWMVRPLGIETVRRLVTTMELETRQFYERAAHKTTDASTRQLLTDLAEAEAKHSTFAESLEREYLTPEAKHGEEESSRRLFVLRVVQPGLAGLMDGSVSTLAPLFAAAFATHDTSAAFRVGLAASVGAGISMGFAEALSDDGALTGRGTPILRGAVCGLMTCLGGIGHTMPYLIPNFGTATVVAMGVVAAELLAISYIRKKYMDTPFLAASIQVIIGGLLVFLTGILIGRS
jgi:rubrerythrin